MQAVGHMAVVFCLLHLAQADWVLGRRSLLQPIEDLQWKAIDQSSL